MKTLLTISILIGTLIGGSYEFKLNKSQSTLSILGTSSLHDWESVANNFSVAGSIDDQSITNLEVTVEVKSIKSGKSIMDSKTYNALNADDYPNILFKAASLKIVGNAISGNGALSIAGQTKNISIDAEIVSQPETELRVRGLVDIVMSEFGVDPPTAMFGSLKTGDQVTIKYELLLTK